MKKFILALAAMVLTAGLISAQDMAQATELAKNGNDALGAQNYTEALNYFQQALDMATQLEGDEAAALVEQCKGIIPNIALEIAKDLFARFAQKGIRLVDPCMADNGKLYAGFTPEFAKEMNSLCAIADIICPNLTEASFLLDIPYQEEYDEAYIKDVLVKLTDSGAKKAILTGISFEKDKLGAYAYDSEKDEFYYYCNDEESTHFHGTGDIWASTFIGALVRGKDFKEAIRIACDYVKECIRLTLAEENHNDYGVNFEQAFPYLLDRLNS